MNDAIIVLISIFCAFVMGVVVMLFAGRGFFIPMLKAVKSGYLLRIHRDDGVTARYVVGKIGKSGLIEYEDNGEKKVVSAVEGAAKRVGRAWVLDIDENTTAPYVYKNVVPFNEEYTDEQGNKQFYTAYQAFQPYKDSPVLANALQWALMRPKRAFGVDFDFKTILIVLAVVGLGFFLLMKLMSDGDAAPVAPVANGVINASQAVIP